MKISVIIPVYNGEKTVARAIDSVLAQTRPADEVIVVDDGSTDGTAEIIQSYGDKVIYIHQQNAGASVARNAGIQAASGDWIAFLDADDEWLPKKLKLQSEHLARNPELKWTFSNMSWDKDESGIIKPIHPINRLNDICKGTEYFEDYFIAYKNSFFVSTITVMIHRSVFDKVGRFEPGMKRAQDNDLWYRIAYQYPKVGYLSEPLAVYHLDTPGSSTKINDSVAFMIDLVRRHEKLSKQAGRYEAFRPCIRNMVQTWVRERVCSKRYEDVKILLNQFGDYMPPHFKREMRFRLACPPLTTWIADGAMELKKILKR